MRWWRPDPLVLVIAVLAIVVGLPPAVYLADALLLRFRMANGPGQPLEATTVYLATRLKNGKLEIFSDQPQTEVCAHALFPHFGYRPCWYVRRTGFVKVI